MYVCMFVFVCVFDCFEGLFCMTENNMCLLCVFVCMCVRIHDSITVEPHYNEVLGT